MGIGLFPAVEFSAVKRRISEAYASSIEAFISMLWPMSSVSSGTAGMGEIPVGSKGRAGTGFCISYAAINYTRVSSGTLDERPP